MHMTMLWMLSIPSQPKFEIIMQAKKAEVPVISSMGAGNKLDPNSFSRKQTSNKTKVCPTCKSNAPGIKKTRRKKA